MPKEQAAIGTVEFCMAMKCGRMMLNGTQDLLLEGLLGGLISFASVTVAQLT
jgi:hypothetical protein